MQKIFDLCFEIEFYLKVAIFCTLFQQFFSWILHDIELNFISQVILYWLVGSVSFYGIGLFIEKVIKNNDKLKAQFNVRRKKVKQQLFPSWKLQGFILGEIKGFIAALIIIYLAPETHRDNSLLPNFSWFLMRIFVADFCFYVSHWLLHRKFLQKIHFKHHEFRDTSSFVAGHKSFLEYIIVTVTDLLPIFIFGYDIHQICAWILIGNAYNLEGHSSLSIFFIPSDFHDLHHTCYKGNYGIQGFWDRVFNTLNPPTKKLGIMFPIASLENIAIKKYQNYDEG